MNVLFRLMLAVLVLTGAGTLRAVELVGAPRIEVKESAAIIRWTTDSECGSRVRFGVAPGQLPQQARAEGVGIDHLVSLDALKPGTTYFYSVETSRKSLAVGSFKTPGVPQTSGGAKSGGVARESAAPLPRRAPSTRRIWGNPASLPDHFERHGRDFGARDSAEYARFSWEFLQRALDEGLPAKVDESDGTLRVWDPKTKAFGAYNRDGTTKTYFKPGSPDYFERQPGRPTKLKRGE